MASATLRRRQTVRIRPPQRPRATRLLQHQVRTKRSRFPLHVPSKIYPVQRGDYELVHAAVESPVPPRQLVRLRARGRALPIIKTALG